MKVTYDISLLGIGHRDPVNRTGTFRVVESIAHELLASEECDLTFCASYSFQALSASLDYLRCCPKLEKVPLPHWKPKNIIDNKLYEIDTKISRSSEHDLPLQALRFGLKLTNKITESYSYPLNLKSLSKSDLYHSPCFPIPNTVKQIKNIKKFLTVYDLIPILFPHLFELNNKEFLQEILNSLDPQDWILCISESTKNDLCNYLNNIDPAKVFVTPLAASPNLFYPCSSVEDTISVQKKYHIPDAPYVLSICTLEPRKNIDHVIRCFAKLVQEQKLKDLYLVLVGTKGWSYSKIFEEISNFDLVKDRIIITGYVADEDLAALYSGALAFAYLSFYEGFGLPPLEAMQCGVPVITSNTSSLPEVVGDAGIMLDPLDVDGLCQSMLDIYSDSALRKQMSWKSLERSKQFSWEKCIQETLAAYRTALSS